MLCKYKYSGTSLIGTHTHTLHTHTHTRTHTHTHTRTHTQTHTHTHTHTYVYVRTYVYKKALHVGRRGSTCDCGNYRMQVFDQYLKHVSSFGRRGSKLGELNCPIDVAFDDAGHVYVVEYSNHRVQKFSPRGERKKEERKKVRKKERKKERKK